MKDDNIVPQNCIVPVGSCTYLGKICFQALEQNFICTNQDASDNKICGGKDEPRCLCNASILKIKFSEKKITPCDKIPKFSRYSLVSPNRAIELIEKIKEAKEAEE
jgi:hypothetical protein